MYNLAISNTVDRTGPFVVAAVATADVSTCSPFWVWYVRGSLRNLATKIFDLSVLILGVSLYVYLPIQTLRIVFFYIRGKSVFSSVWFTVPVFSVSSSHGTFETKKWRSWYRWTAPGLYEWTAGPFTEPCILLQIASAVQSFPSVI